MTCELNVRFKITTKFDRINPTITTKVELSVNTGHWLHGYKRYIVHSALSTINLKCTIVIHVIINRIHIKDLF